LTIELIKGENLGTPTFEGKISPHNTTSVLSQYVNNKPDKSTL